MGMYHSTRFHGLVLALVLAVAAVPAMADEYGLQHAREEGVNELLVYMDQTWLAPNGLNYEYMVAEQPTDLSILLGLALRSQSPHTEKTPALKPAFNELATECADYLNWLAGTTRAATDPWGNPMGYETLRQVFLTAVQTTTYDQYSIDAYGVDPLPLVHRDLLTPIAQAADPSFANGQTPEPSGKYQPKDDPKGIILLGVEADPVEINVNPMDSGPDTGSTNQPADGQ